jgi:hypothetical protein
VLAKKYNLPFMELSAKTGENVVRTFEVMGEKMVNDILPLMNLDKNKTRLSRLSGFQGDQSKKKKGCEC